MLTIITSPYIQFFLLALCAGLLKSDLKIPDQITKAISIFLLIAIGLKGGLSLRESTINYADFALIASISVLISFLIPFIGYFILSFSKKIRPIDAVAVAAHYGSVSVVTFSYAVSFLQKHNIPEFSGTIVTLMAIMEIPAIFSALIIANYLRKKQRKGEIKMGRAFREELFNGSVVLLLGSLFVGLTANPEQLQKIKPFIIDPFYAVLCIFLIELGLIVASEIKTIRSLPKYLVAFAVLFPIFNFLIGASIASFFMDSFADRFLFGVLCASASYIAIPATIKNAIPEANPAIYVTCSLGITFPFNLIFGMPLYFELTKLF
jgi:hypothetical protein